MCEHLSRDSHAERAAVGEVDGSLTTWHVLLLEKHLALRPAHGSPITYTALQRA